MKKYLKQFTTAQVPLRKIGKKYFFVLDQLDQFSQKIDLEPYAIGTQVGTEFKGHLRPHPAIADVIATFSHKKGVINAKAEWLYLCDRDAFNESVLEYSEGYLIVYNRLGDVLGLGQGVNGKIKNVLDKGMYLRMEKN